MSELTDLLNQCGVENLSGTLSHAYIIANCDLDTHASTYAEDAVIFDENTDYAVDDLVNYHGSVYTCSIIHSAGAWNAANFTLILNGNVRINGAHVPTAGKGFVRVDLNDDESTYGHESLGKRFSRNGRNMASIFVPQNSINAAEFVVQVRNSNGCTVLIPLPDGKVVQIGTRKSVGEITGSYQGGTQSNPDSRWLLDVSAYAKSLCYYEAAIPLLNP